MGSGGPGCGMNSTWPVCSKLLGNSLSGLCDMTGNVWEWTQDCWHNNYQAAPNDGSAWQHGACEVGVIRGGSWLNEARFLRSVYRSRYSRAIRSNANGFRLVSNSQK